MYPVSSEGLNKETSDAVYFFTPAFDALNNFSAHQVTLWGIRFPTCEHAYQWKKFADGAPEVAELILEAGSPELANQIAPAHKTRVPKKVYEQRVEIMEEVLRAKLVQHEDVREILRKTGTRMIVENSPVDSFWGIGPEGTGANHLGKLWMKLREA